MQQSQDECAFCPRPAMKTHWYEETDTAILMNNFAGRPMVVLKRHTTEPTDKEREHCMELAETYFVEPSFRVMMNVVTDHWHAHIMHDGRRNE